MRYTGEKTIFEEKEVIRALLGPDGDIALDDFGWTSRVYIINSGEIVFKFPRSAKVKKEYKLEIPAYKLACEIADGILIPQVRWEHPDNNYLGYKGIVGRSFDKEASNLTTAERKRAGARLGAFLSKFHKCTLPTAPRKFLEKEFAEHKNKLALGLPAIKKYFTNAEVARITRLVLEEYPLRMERLGFKKGLCHGDLGYSNLICGPHGRIGIIDFGDVGYYDTSIDFAGMIDKDMLEAALEAYGEDISIEKIKLRQKVIPLFDLPFFAAKKDSGGIGKTIERIRKFTLK
jgi:aminoglycoside phosphotransferase (APT) family kinase protein